LKSRMRENRTCGSVRGSRQSLHDEITRKECRDFVYSTDEMKIHNPNHKFLNETFG